MDMLKGNITNARGVAFPRYGTTKMNVIDGGGYVVGSYGHMIAERKYSGLGDTKWLLAYYKIAMTKNAVDYVTRR